MTFNAINKVSIILICILYKLYKLIYYTTFGIKHSVEFTKFPYFE